jgi:hypothetical protein
VEQVWYIKACFGFNNGSAHVHEAVDNFGGILVTSVAVNVKLSIF